MNRQLIEALIKNGRLIDALGEASRWGDRGQLTRLLDMNLDPNIAGFSGHLPIHLAASGGQVDAVVQLLERGADPNLLDNKDGGNAIYWCLYASHPKDVYVAICRILLQHGAAWGLTANNGTTINELAAQKGITLSDCG